MTRRPSSQSRAQARGIARRFLREYGGGFNAMSAVALIIAGYVADGYQPHPDMVQAFRLLDRLVSARQAAWRAAA
jgi:hypothetical protein